MNSFKTMVTLLVLSITTQAVETAVFNNVLVKDSEFIQGNLTVDGTISSDSSCVITGPTSSIPNSAARFVDTSGSKLTDSPVLIDDLGNVTLQGITKNGNTVSWPSIVGAANTFLASDGAGNLVYGTPAGAGNVDTALAFTADDRIVTTDFSSGVMNIKESSVTLDSSDNISGVNELTAVQVNATLNGSATNFTGALVGDVTGTQGATVVSLVGGVTAANVAAGATLANDATDANTASAIVRRDGSGDFAAGTITADLVGNVTGNVSGTAASATDFTGALVGDVTGTQGATVVALVDGVTAANIAAGATLANDATDANTASAIVRRDGSGDFAAGTITAGLLGNVTGDLTGNADTATAASSVGGQSAANVAAATIAANAATANDMADTIVLRDASSNFATNMITLNGTVTNPTDATTKEYVDAAVAGGFTVEEPAQVVSTSNVAISGLQTIDGVTLVANDRVLLVGQTDPVENGLWLAQAGAWTRPADFDTGDAAGTAYVLILQGTTNAGTSWVCTTPAAIIDTDPIMFSPFSIPGQTTAANVGAGAGRIFRDKVGNVLNFKSIAADTHTIVTNNSDDIAISTDATDANTPGTIVARNGSGNFSAGTITASLTGAASDNVLKSGDTMTGALQLPAGSTAAPSLNFTGSPTTGLSATSDELSISTNALERLKVSSTGTVTINQFSTSGVVHNDASGNLSSSLIVDADISDSAAIQDTKLATISTPGKVANSATTATSANTPNAIVARDGSGDFSAGTITANLTGSASNNVLRSGDTMTGPLTLPAGTAASPSLRFNGSTNTGISAQTANRLSLDTNGSERMSISNTDITTLQRLVLMNLLVNQAIQQAVPTVGGSVAVSSTTSILILRHVVNVGGAGFTVIFPPTPINGQFFTIMCGTTNSVSLNNNGNGASVVNPVNSLNPGSNFTSSTNGASVTYLYFSATNTWYRYGRG